MFLNKKDNEGFLLHLHISFSQIILLWGFWPILHHQKSEPVEKSGDWSQMTASLAAPLYTTDFARSPFIREVSYNFINIWQRQLEIYVALSASIWNIECPTMQWISRSNRVFRALKYKRFVGLTSSLRPFGPLGFFFHGVGTQVVWRVQLLSPQESMTRSLLSPICSLSRFKRPLSC